MRNGRAIKRSLAEVYAKVQQYGPDPKMFGRWVRAYRSEGEAGLATHYRGKGRSLPTPVKQKIVEVKETNPLFGIKRISQVLKRTFFLSASPETVRKTLHDNAGPCVPLQVHSHDRRCSLR
jgi:transposase